MTENKNTWFPVYVNLAGKKILVVGGGTIALRRIRTLQSFGPKLCCISRTVSEELKTLALTGSFSVLERDFQDADISGQEMVLACTGDPEVNHRIVRLCREAGIPVNNCADQTECDFYFPAVIRTEDDVVIGVNAGGRDHRLVRRIREKIQAFLEEK